jgi:hypothetical protein
MKYGNCFIGALYGMIKLKSLKLRILQRGIVPHFYIIKNKKKYHYDVVRDILPFPWGLFIYQGQLKEIK